MAQGSHKLGKATKSAGAQKRKAVRTVKKTKKGNTKTERNNGILAATKAINKKNERLIASKALNAGANFSLTDIADKGKAFSLSFAFVSCGIFRTNCTMVPLKGKNEARRQTADRDKKQSKPSKLSQRLVVRLNKLKK